jgi:hypothetical protein
MTEPVNPWDLMEKPASPDVIMNVIGHDPDKVVIGLFAIDNSPRTLRHLTSSYLRLEKQLAVATQALRYIATNDDPAQQWSIELAQEWLQAVEDVKP